MIVSSSSDVQFGDDQALLPVIVKDGRSGAVLTLAWANREALERTLHSGETWLWSRSRAALWNKGATSGHRQRVLQVSTDCDGDALLYEVERSGPACHTGSESCFSDHGHDGIGLRSLRAVLEQRRDARPEGSYSTYLFDQGLDKILKKVGEEATEVIIAAKGDDHQRIVEEVADLMYHVSVMLVERSISIDALDDELRRRAEKGSS